MANRSRSSLFIIVATVLMLISFGKGTYEQCVLRNIVVYEGELNMLLSCSNGPNGTAIVVRPTSNSATPYQIDNYNDVVAPNLTGLYAINETGLIIRNATTLPTGGPISTAGFYIVSLDPKNSANRTAFKLIVIRSGPTCYCSQLSANASVSISCQIVYADHPSYPINAVMSCSSASNGQSYNTTTPTKILIPSTPTQYVWNSTSTVTVNNPEPATYDCVMAFSKPGAAPPAYAATNPPDFSVNRQVFCGETTTASPTTTTQRTTTAELPSTTTKVQATTTKPATTLTIPLTITVQPSTTATRLLTTTAESLSSTSSELKSTTEEDLTTIPLASAPTTNPIDHRLLSSKIALATVLGTLMASVAALGGCCGFLFCCPLFSPISRPARYIVDEMQRLPRREWIPAAREIRRLEFRVIPFYRQSFCKTCPTPYEYRLPMRDRCG